MKGIEYEPKKTNTNMTNGQQNISSIRRKNVDNKNKYIFYWTKTTQKLTKKMT